MKTILIAAALSTALLLSSCAPSAPVQFVKEENERAVQYHILTSQLKESQAKLNDFVGEWLKICKAKNQVLTADTFGEPACAAGQPAPPTPANPAGDQKAVGMRGQVQTNAPPKK